MKRFIGYLTAALFLISLLIRPGAAQAAVRDAIVTCGGLIIPSLFPFFVAVGLLTRLGATDGLSKMLAPICMRLFGVSGSGAAAFITGITAGYPIGAAHIAELHKNGAVSSDEAGRLLIFCNNSGPAFIIGAAGIGVFGSVKAGLFLSPREIF